MGAMSQPDGAAHASWAAPLQAEGITSMQLTPGLWPFGLEGMAHSSVLRWKLQNQHPHGGTYANPTS